MNRLFASLLVALLVAGCNNDGLSPVAEGDAGRPDLGRACSTAQDDADCQALGCMPVGCPICGGGETFLLCVAPGEPYGVLCTNPCPQPACASLATAADCDARTDCHSLFSGDLPCNSSGCNNHFEQCEDGATAACSPSGGGPSCTKLTPQCAGGDSLAYLSNNCPDGCVHTDRCAP